LCGLCSCVQEAQIPRLDTITRCTRNVAVLRYGPTFYGIETLSVLRGTNLSTVGTVPYRVMRSCGYLGAFVIHEAIAGCWMSLFLWSGGAVPTHVEWQVRGVSHGRHAEARRACSTWALHLRHCNLR
jgi:hypothetical protein